MLLQKKLVQSLVSIAVEHLKDPHHVVRRQCLKLIGHLSSCSSSSAICDDIQMLVISYAKDSDPRVRTSALEALVSKFVDYCYLFLAKDDRSLTIDSEALKDFKP